MGWRKRPWMALFDEPDQERVREELALFFGPRPRRYLAAYEKMRDRFGRNRLMVLTWSWPAFLCSAAWLMYRRMTLMGAFLLLYPFLLFLVVGAEGFLLQLLLILFGKLLYVQEGLKRIHAADRLGLADEERRQYLRQSGGVSWLGVCVHAFIAMGLMAMYATVEIKRLMPEFF